MAATAIRYSFLEYHRPRKKEIWTTGLEHPLRIQPGGFRGFNEIFAEAFGRYGHEASKFCAILWRVPECSLIDNIKFCATDIYLCISILIIFVTQIFSFALAFL